MTRSEARRRAERAMSEYAYWTERAREHAASLGYSSEVYRAAAQSAYRWLGRFDVYNELAYLTPADELVEVPR